MTDRHYYKSTLPWTDNVLNVSALNKRREKLGGILERETDDARAFNGWTNVFSFPVKLSSLQEADLCVEYYQHP
jgi:hypothetical protein